MGLVQGWIFPAWMSSLNAGAGIFERKSGAIEKG
jgi:hypothetical protein